MPRMARKKTLDSIFHVMGRSIDEVDLFMGGKEDKEKFLSIVKKYETIFNFKVYGYCIMDNHYHLIIDANGCDISTVMKCINLSYARYFNRKHRRRGHLFYERFKSEIIYDESYIINASAYVHNNPCDIEGYKDSPEKYSYSSLAIYLGYKKDPYELIDDSFVLSLFGNDSNTARYNYLKTVFACDDKDMKVRIEFENQPTRYESGRKILVRNFIPSDITNFVAQKMNISPEFIYLKNKKDLINGKAIVVVLMRCLCNFKCKQVCEIFGNITQSRVSSLSSVGINLIRNDKRYSNILNEFIIEYSV